MYKDIIDAIVPNAVQVNVNIDNISFHSVINIEINRAVNRNIILILVIKEVLRQIWW